MKSTSPAFPSTTGMKRSRDDDEDGVRLGDRPFDKKARPTLNSDGELEPWHHDSVIDTPRAFSQQSNYDSDEQSSSVASEPGSPQDIASSGEDMEMGDMASHLRPTREARIPNAPLAVNKSPGADRMESRHRVATPFAHSGSGARPMWVRTSYKQHVQDGNPQENSGSVHLEVPSPIDEDEVATPPSAADAAGSQLSMLSVDDMDIERPANVPSITINPTRSSGLDEAGENHTADSAEPPSRGSGHSAVARKQRQRSGAQSNGSPSPGRASGMEIDHGGTGGKKGLSIGYRAECEKCRMRVPGHMNHFIT